MDSKPSPGAPSQPSCTSVCLLTRVGTARVGTALVCTARVGTAGL